MTATWNAWTWEPLDYHWIPVCESGAHVIEYYAVSKSRGERFCSDFLGGSSLIRSGGGRFDRKGQ